MTEYELLIACRDEIESHRKKEGDIVSFNHSPWNWGRKETCKYLIVPIYTSMCISELHELIEPVRENGLLFKELPLQIVWDKDGNMAAPMPDDSSPTKKKRRFQIPLDILTGWIPDLDFARVRDTNDHYQPFKQKGIVINMDEKVAIAKDKVKGSFKYGKRKTATK